MSDLKNASKDELLSAQSAFQKKYNDYKAMNLSLDMSRGKPSPDQLDISNGLLKGIENYKTSSNTDIRNYGVLDGLPEVKKLFSELLDISEKNIIIGGNSALNLIYDTFVRNFLFGTLGNKPWCKLPKIKFLCPVPGYDRHFAICEEFGIEMISIPMNEDGPDMDMVEKLVETDDTIKGLMCVPLYSNPDGTCYSEETAERLAKMKTAATDFCIFWDNAYGVHHVYSEEKLPNIFKIAEKYGTQDRIYYFFSTSKINFPGSGIAFIAASDNNIKEIKRRISIQTIGYNKINQLNVLEFFKTADGIKKHMQKHAEILKPKFDTVLDCLEKELGNSGICHWTKPKGGYFIALYTLDGCAKRTVQLAKEVGVVLTEAGATHPYKNNPNDNCIRLAPTYPKINELKNAIEIVCVCAKIACIEKLLENK